MEEALENFFRLCYDVSMGQKKQKPKREYQTGDLVLVPGKNKVGMSHLYPAVLLSRYVSEDDVVQPHLWRVMYVGDELPKGGERFVSTSVWDWVDRW